MEFCPGICGRRSFNQRILPLFVGQRDISKYKIEYFHKRKSTQNYQSVWCSVRKARHNPFSKSEHRDWILFKAQPRPRELQVHILPQNILVTFSWNFSPFRRQRISPTQNHSFPWRRARMLNVRSAHGGEALWLLSIRETQHWAPPSYTNSDFKHNFEKIWKYQKIRGKSSLTGVH